MFSSNISFPLWVSWNFTLNSTMFPAEWTYQFVRTKWEECGNIIDWTYSFVGTKWKNYLLSEEICMNVGTFLPIWNPAPAWNDMPRALTLMIWPEPEWKGWGCLGGDWEEHPPPHLGQPEEQVSVQFLSRNVEDIFDSFIISLIS